VNVSPKKHGENRLKVNQKDTRSQIRKVMIGVQFVKEKSIALRALL
jgi:hypothetical protein